MIGHKADCAVHNEPAYPNGPCDCGFSENGIRYGHKWVENIVEVAGKEVLVREDPFICEICGKLGNDENLQEECK